MSNIPANCTVCPFERRCNSGMSFPGCHFYEVRKEDKSLVLRLKNYFGKLFR